MDDREKNNIFKNIPKNILNVMPTIDILDKNDIMIVDSDLFFMNCREIDLVKKFNHFWFSDLDTKHFVSDRKKHFSNQCMELGYNDIQVATHLQQQKTIRQSDVQRYDFNNAYIMFKAFFDIIYGGKFQNTSVQFSKLNPHAGFTIDDLMTKHSLEEAVRDKGIISKKRKM